MNRLLAQVAIDPPLKPGKTISATFPTIGSFLSVILKNSLTLVGVILLVLLVFGGLTYIIGAGSDDSKKTAQGRAVVTSALLGFAVVLLAYFIVQIIEVITGINILNPNL